MHCPYQIGRDIADGRLRAGQRPPRRTQPRHRSRPAGQHGYRNWTWHDGRRRSPLQPISADIRLAGFCRPAAVRKSRLWHVRRQPLRCRRYPNGAYVPTLRYVRVCRARSRARRGGVGYSKPASRMRVRRAKAHTSLFGNRHGADAPNQPTGVYETRAAHGRRGSIKALACSRLSAVSRRTDQVSPLGRRSRFGELPGVVRAEECCCGLNACGRTATVQRYVADMHRRQSVLRRPGARSADPGRSTRPRSASRPQP